MRASVEIARIPVVPVQPINSPSIPFSTGECQPPEPLVYDSADMCKVLRSSLATLHRLKAARKLPRPLRLGGQLRWAASEIQEWVAAGMPDQQKWEPIWQAMCEAKNGRR